jgi:phosphorylase/glycogen(starch) synthase
MIIYEVSFEICNKVGGIYTVVSSKVPALQPIASRHILIGPWLPKSSEEFIQAAPKDVPPEIQRVFDILSQRKIYCTYGHWSIRGFPETILINFLDFAAEKNAFKTLYWEKFGVDSLFAGWDFEEPLCFATAAGILIEELTKKSSEKCVAQFHEWLAGFGILYLKREKSLASSLVKTIFTTHATTLGRSLSERGIFVHALPVDFVPDSVARDFGVIAKHSVEKACAHISDFFTTVSDITAKETEILLQKAPDVLTYNGLDLASFLEISEQEAIHKSSHLILENFASNYFDCSLSKVPLIYTSGRPEFSNKGYDVLLESLSILNKKNISVVCFFFVPWKHYQLKDAVEQKLRGGTTPCYDISPYYLDNESEHQILKKCAELGLNNKGSVKIILYPPYLGTSDEIIFKKNYYHLVAGCDLGIFASSYEPWGYTPLESLAVGVPAITTDQSGFGLFMEGKQLQLRDGFEILYRKNKGDVSKDLASMILSFSKLKNKRSIAKKAHALASLCDWKNFISRYISVYEK